MFCPKCGKEVEDDAVVCVNCGCALNENRNSRAEYKTDKTGMGVLLAFVLGLIGLIIGLCLYPEMTVARKTFLKAWGITYGCTIGVSLFLIIIALCI